MKKNDNIVQPNLHTTHFEPEDWVEICKNRNLSEAFIELHLDRLSSFDLLNNQKMSAAFIEKHFDVFRDDLMYLNELDGLTKDFIYKYQEYLPELVIRDNLSYKEFQDLIDYNEKLRMFK